MLVNEQSVAFMHSDSVISQFSCLSHLSNLSYHEGPQMYDGTEFFKESLPPGHPLKLTKNGVKQEEIQLGSLDTSSSKTFVTSNDGFSAFTPYWTSDLHQGIQGTSDDEGDNDFPLLQDQNKVKIEQGFDSIDELTDPFEEKAIPETFLNEKVMKNQTKNIPKNYGKAIIIFIEKNKRLVQKVLKANGDNYDALVEKLSEFKKKINTISDLRYLWEEQPESKSIRMISNAFLRKYSLHYIYNSRIRTRICHSKYKNRLQQALRNPKDFNHIKQY